MAIKFLSGLNLSNVTAGSILKLDSNGNIVAATAGTDYVASSLWTASGSNIYYSSGNVTIGASSNSAPLHVYGYQTTDPKILIEDGNTGDASMQFKISTQSYTMGIDNSDADKFKFSSSTAFGTNNIFTINTNSVSFLTNVFNSGTINTRGNDYGILNTYGSLGNSYAPQEGGTAAVRYWVMFDYTNNASYPFLTNRTPSGAVVIKTGTAAGGGENEHFRIKGGDGTVDAYFTNAKLGIGTTDPKAPLHVWTGEVSGSLQEVARLQGNWTTNPSGPLLRFTNQHNSGDNPNSGEYNLAGIAGIDDNSSWGGSLYFYTSPTGDSGGANLSTRMVIKSDGKVGIGTTSPSSRLHVNNENSESGLTISRGGTDLSAGTAIGTIQFNADYQGSPISYGSIDMYANSLSGVRSSLDFNVKSTSGSIQTGLTVQGNSGTPRVGIGITGPVSKLHVYGSSSGATAYQSGNDGLIVERGGRAAVNLLSPANSDSYVFFGNPTAGNAGYVGYENTANRLVIKSSDYISLLDSTGEAVRIDGGKVSIGTTTASYKLHVNGDIGAKPLDYKYIVSTNQIDSYSYSQKSLMMPLNGYLWHDLFAFDYLYTRTQEVSSDGSTWTSASLQTALFNQKQNQSITVIDTDETAVRWTFQGVAWSVADFLNIAFSWVNSDINKTVLVESSSDGSTWTTRHTSTATAGISTKTCYLSGYGGDNYLRITIAKASSSTNPVRLSSLKLMTARAGDQGRGSEYHFPYVWDSSRNIAIRSNSTDSNFGLLVGSNTKISSGGVSSKATLEINNTSSATFNHSINAFAPNLASGENNIFIIGRAGSTKNSGYVGYKYSSAGSNANVLTFGHWASDNLMNLTGDGKLGIGTESPGTMLAVRATTASHQLVGINRANSDTAALYLGNNSSNDAIISGNNAPISLGKDVSGTYTEYVNIATDGELKFSAYGAGILKTNSAGIVSLDTNTYLTSVDVDWNDIDSVADSIDLNSTVQIGQGDTETIVSFQNSSTERGRFEVDSATNSYFVATGFKTTGSGTGLLKSDGTIDTSTYATTADINSFIEITDVATYLSTNNYATESYVTTAISNLVDSAPATLDTLNELAAALGDDANFSTTVTTSIGTKVSKAGDTMTGGLNIEVSTSNTQLKLKRTTSATGEFNIYTNTDSLYFHNVGQSSYPMMINSSGNVGIGTTSPGGRLELNGSGQSWTTAPAIRMWDSYNSKGWLVGSANNVTAGDFYIRTLPGEDTNPGTGNTEFTIKHATGYIGIGTTSPSAKLNVQIPESSDGSRQEIQRWVNTAQNSVSLFAYGGSTDLIQIGAWNGEQNIAIVTEALSSISATTAKGIYIKSGGNVGIGTTNPGTYKLNVVGERVLFQNTGDVEVIINADTDNVTETDAPMLTFKQDATHNMLHLGGNGTTAAPDFTGLLDNNAYIIGGTGHGGTVDLQIGTNGTAWMIVKRDGKVGIGTDSPSTPLHVKSSSNSVATFETTSTADMAIELKNSQGSMFFGLGGGEEFAIGTDADLNGPNSKFVVKNNGNVGIGTTSPGSKLEVAGEAKVTSLLISDSNSGLLKGHGDAYHGIMFRGTPSGATTYGITAGDQISFYEYGGEFRFYQKNNVGGGTLSEVARIHHTNSFFDSSVGIGTTSPGGKLHLEGNFESGKALVIKGTYGTDTEYYFRTHGTNSEYLALYAAGTRIMNFNSGIVDTYKGLRLFGGAISTGTSNHLVIGSSVQIGQGDEDPVIEFKYGTTSLGKIDQFGDIHAGGFKVSGTTGFLKSDGSVDTSTYAASGHNHDSDYVLSTGGYYDEDFTWDGTHDFQNVIKVSGASATTTNTTALFYGTNGVIEKRSLGSAAFSDSTDFAAASHTHSYLPLSGGTLTGDLLIDTGTTGSTTQAYSAFDSLQFNNQYSSVAAGPNKIVMYDDGGSWVGGFGIHTSTVGYYSGDTHKWYKTASGPGGPTFTQKMSLDSSGNLAVTGTFSASGYNNTNWDTAYGWGNHASANYLTSYTETSTLGQVLTRGNSTNNTIHIYHTDRAYTFQTDTTWGGWARTPFYFEDGSGNGFGGLGAYGGNGTTLSKYYIGSAYNSNIIEFHTDNSVIMSGNLTLPDKIIHSGDADTYIKFDADRVRIVAGNVTKFDSNTIYTGTVQSVSGAGTVSGLTLTSDDDSVDPTLTLGGSITTPVSGDWWNNGFAKVGTDGVMEIGKYIDFHDTDTETDDFSYRITASNTALTFSGALSVPEFIYHTGDSNTYVWLTADRIRLVAGGTTKLDTSNTYLLQSTNISVRSITARDIVSESDRTYSLGTDANRWAVVFCETLDSAGQHESKLQNPEGETPISEYETGTVLVWKGGKNVPCTKAADHMRMGIAVKGIESPLVQGAEPVLCTGEVKEGDYLVTSTTEGHAEAISPEFMRQHMLFDCVIGKALEDGAGESHLVKTWINI